MGVSLSITLLLTLCKLLTLVYTRLLDLSLVYITRAVSLFLSPFERPRAEGLAGYTRANRLFHRFLLCFTGFSSDCINLAIEIVPVYLLASTQRKRRWVGGDLYKANSKLGLIWKWAESTGKPQINFGSTNFTVGSFFPFPLVCARPHLISRVCEHYRNDSSRYTVRYSLYNDKSTNWTLRV